MQKLVLRVSSGFQTLENNKTTACGLVVSKVSRVWKPDETLALVVEILLKIVILSKIRSMSTVGFSHACLMDDL